MALACSYSVRSVILRLTSSINTSWHTDSAQPWPLVCSLHGIDVHVEWAGEGAHDFVEHCEGDLRHATQRQQQGECGERLLACGAVHG